MDKGYSVKCRFCDVLLEGREQFIGHMYHSHEMSYEHLKAAWQSLFNNGRRDTVAWHRELPPRHRA